MRIELGYQLAYHSSNSAPVYRYRVFRIYDSNYVKIFLTVSGDLLFVEPKKILLSSYDYPPRIGGVAKCGHALKVALNERKDIIVQVCAPLHSESSNSESQTPESSKANKRPDYFYRYSGRPEWAFFSLLLSKHRAIRDWKPDFVLDILWFPDGLASYLLSFLYPKLKYAVIVHGVEILEGKRTWKKRIRKAFSPIKRKVIENAAAIFPVSTFTRGLLEKEMKNGHDQPIPFCAKPFQNGVDSSSFCSIDSSPRMEEKDNKQRPIFFSLARLEDYKGIDKTIAALCLLKRKGKTFSYRVGGTGPDLPRLRKLAEEFNLQEEITFLGKLSDREVLCEYQKCDAFVLLSRVDLEAPNVEGFGLVYLEAALCGKASLGPNEGGPTDAIVHGKTGLLVNPRKEEEIANALETFFDRNFSESLGIAAKERALKYSWHRSAQLIIEGLQICAE